MLEQRFSLLNPQQIHLISARKVQVPFTIHRNNRQRPGIEELVVADGIGRGELMVQIGSGIFEDDLERIQVSTIFPNDLITEMKFRRDVYIPPHCLRGDDIFSAIDLEREGIWVPLSEIPEGVQNVLRKHAGL